MTWFDIVKIKDASGKYLKVENYHRMKPKFRAIANSIAVQKWGQANRKSYVRMNAYPRGHPTNFNLTLRHPTYPDRRLEYVFIFGDDNDEVGGGDIYYIGVNGPNLRLTLDSEVADEDVLVMRFMQAVQADIGALEPIPKEPTQIKDMERGGKTQFQIDRELGEANPDHISEGGKMKVSPFKGLLNWARRSQDKAPPSSPSTKPKKKRGWFRRITGR